MTFMERMAPVVDDTIRALSNVRFMEDPIAGVKHSRATSIISSAYKRHGRILERALLESLRESNRHKVWNDNVFKVSREADALTNTQDSEACEKTTLPYGNSVRTLQVDMVAFDSADETIRAYEIKRGNGQFDAGKIRSIVRDLKCIQVLLKSYGEVSSLRPTAAQSRIIFYYGVRSISRLVRPPDWNRRRNLHKRRAVSWAKFRWPARSAPGKHLRKISRRPGYTTRPSRLAIDRYF